jgi:short-subunit dehydrogenase involved in D-alanine esterification of teichoic acids
MPAPETVLVNGGSSGIGRALSRRFTPRLLARKLSGWLNRRRRNVIFVCSSVSPL